MSREDFVLIAALITLSVFGLAVQAAAKPPAAARIARIREYVHDQKQDLSDAQSRLGWTWNELQAANTQIAHVGDERDWYRAHYESDEVELAKYRKHGIFAGILSAVGVVFSFVTNPFAFIVGRALQIVFGIGLALIIFAVAFFIIRRIKKTHETHP